MSKTSAIDAYLVDVKNVNTHKVVELKIHVPQERAMEVFELFGWPTMVNPVSIAIARLRPTFEIGKQIIENTEDFDKQDAIIRLTDQPVMADASTCEDEVRILDVEQNPQGLTSATKPKREITLAERIGIICSDENFRKFLQLEKTVIWNNVLKYPRQAKTREWIVAEVVRVICGVNSRSEITYDSEPATKWKQLYIEFQDWLSSSIKGEER